MILNIRIKNLHSLERQIIRKKYEQMELGTKPVWFNDEGGIEEFTNAVYVREVARLGDNPYVYLSKCTKKMG